MKPNLTREFIADTLSQSVLDPRTRALYDLCFMHRDHLRDVIVADKLRLIARLFEEYETGAGFSPERGAHCLTQSPVDHWFATVATAEELGGWLPLELHKRVMDVFAELPVEEARSLASKYLHFHFPELFFIHDSLVERAARRLMGEECGYLAMSDHDPAYGQFHACCRKLAERLARDLGRRLSPRELDRVLRAWADIEGAGYGEGAPGYDGVTAQPLALAS
ncbi:MAG: hypothetical protein AB1899_16565 [Pseudomonadota bacterium]